MTENLTMQQDSCYVANTYARFPVEITGGQGACLFDSQGKEYIDMGAGIAVNTFGMCDGEWIQAVTGQLHQFQHTSNLYYTGPCVQLAKMLCQRTGMKKVFFSNSGAEANECAIKAARKYAAQKKGADYYNIVTLNNSFHGRTLATLAATGQDAFHHDFLPLPGGFLYADANDPDALEELVKANKVAGILFEAVQGEGGVLPLDKKFAEKLVEISQKYDILLLADEVQIGNGRSGKLYGYMQLGITPDIVSTAKGLGGGLPLGATMLGQKVQDVFTPGSHGSTFGGNPVCCAGAISILQRLDDAFLQQVQEKSDYVFAALQGAPGIRSVTGMGLMIGLETEKPARQVLDLCMQNGVLVLTAKAKVRLLPPLSISMQQLQKAIDVIQSACAPTA